MTIDERVQRGVKLLDEHYPNWHNHISVSDLDMENCAKCILGQLYGWFPVGKHRLGLNEEYMDEYYGFNTAGTDKVSHSFGDLKRAWIHVIRSRQNA